MTELRTQHPASRPGHDAGPAAGEPTAAEGPALLEAMLFARRLSQRLWNLQRQGRVATVPPIDGQEAAFVGTVFGMDPATDWFAGYYRDLTALGSLGDELVTQVVSYWRGHPDGGRVPEGVRCLPPQIALGSQIPHAAGLAWGLALRGDPGVVCAFIGDGATSEGDFAEGLNLAGVQRAPLVVACVNNGWAISTPADHQTAAATFSAKAAAFGVAGVRVDGNDALAVVGATRAARERAARGDGPTLLELVTFRMGAHTNSDDPGRYVPAAELETWRARDPIDRLRASLAERGAWDDTVDVAAAGRVEARVDAVVDAALARVVDPVDALAHVYATDPPRLARQRAELTTRRDAVLAAPPDADTAPGDETEGTVSWQA